MHPRAVAGLVEEGIPLALLAPPMGTSAATRASRERHAARFVESGWRLAAAMKVDTVPASRDDARAVTKKADSDPLLRLIAFFKLVKSVLFFAAGVGVLHFFHKDVGDRLARLLDHLHVDPDNRYAQALVDEVGKLTDTNLKLVALSIIAFFYSALFGTEGVGLFLRKRWAEWFVVIVTGSLLPLEIYEIIHKISALKIALILVNLLILGYLITVIRRKKK
jgi:uncharacterized membrane protein (DUF2068 family)